MYRVERRAEGQYVTTGGEEFDRVATAAEIEFWNRIRHLEDELAEVEVTLQDLEAEAGQ